MAKKIEDKKDRILATAQKLFARYGFIKTTVDEIAKMSRVAKGTIYNYFENKEMIFEEVLLKENYSLQNEIHQVLSALPTPQEKLQAFTITKIKKLKELSNYYSALRDNYLEYLTFIQNARKTTFNQEVKIMSDILEQGIQEGVFIVEDVKLTALAIITALRGFEYSWTIEEPLTEVEKNINILTNVLFRGIEVR